jgi:hypothetical protein
MESASTDIIQTLLARFDRLEASVAALAGRGDGVGSTPDQPGGPAIHIPRPPAAAPAHRHAVTCKPPKEPSLTGDKQQEWQDFEREFLRYFRISQGFYMEPEVQVDLLLATAGEKVRRVYYQLALPAEDAHDLEKVILAIRKEFAQQHSTVVNKFLFMKIRRDPGEELDSFVSRLRESAKRCAFVDEDQRVLEQLIFSTVDNVDILKRMVKDSPPTLTEVIRILKADEVATHELERMVGTGACIHAVSHKPQSTRKMAHTNGAKNPEKPLTSRMRGGNCENCVFSHSGRDQCPAKEMTCFFCSTRGHMIAKCRKRTAASRGANPSLAPPQHRKRGAEQRNIHGVEQLSDSEESETESVVVDSVFIGSLTSGAKDSWQTAIRIGQRMVNCKIDTGAEVNVMPQRVYNQLRVKPRLVPTKVVLRTVAGQIKPLGLIEVSVQFKRKSSTAKFYVVEDSTPTLCGLQTSVELGLVRKLFQ